MKKNNLYCIYIFIGTLYTIVKIGFVSFGYLHVQAIAHGGIPAILTVVAGVLAFRNPHKPAWQWLMLVFPIVIFLITPVFMYIKAGEQWLSNGRLHVLILYEVMAILQALIAIALLSKTKKA
jgi:hypothetical protein